MFLHGFLEKVAGNCIKSPRHLDLSLIYTLKTYEQDSTTMMYAVLAVSLLLPLASQTQLAGGLSDISLDAMDPNVQFAVKSINSYYSLLGDSEPRTLVDIVHAQSQVVAGTLYHLELRVKSMNQEELCKVKVWSRPWLTGKDALQVTQDPVCKVAMMAKSTMTPIITGGSVLIDVNDADVQKALMFAGEALNARENSLYYRKPVKIEEVKSQVVSGMSYHFRGVHMAATTCLKNTQIKNVDLKVCTLKDPADITVCDFDVWWQSWMTPEYRLMNLKCTPA